MAKKVRILKRPAAPAWASGGSSPRPRLGTPLSGSDRCPVVRKSQMKPKSGALLLTLRGKQHCAKGAPYTPKPRQSSRNEVRLERITAKAEVKVEDILTMSERKLIATCWKGGHLENHTRCTHCKKGTLGPLVVRKHAGGLRRRCRAKGGQKYSDPRAGSAVFTAPSGQDACFKFRKQVGVLHCAAWGLPQRFVPVVIKGVNHKGVDAIYASWRKVLASYVESRENTSLSDETSWDATSTRLTRSR